MRMREKNPLGQIRVEYVLNAVLAVLLVLLFIQCAVYMARFTEIRRTSSEVPFDMRMLSASSEGNTELDPTLLAPEAIAVRTDNGVRALFHSAAVMEEIYGAVNECLVSALTSEATPVSPDRWTNAAAGKCVLVQYSSELPYQVLAAFASAREEKPELPRRGNVYVGVRELLLCPDETGALREVLVRGSSGVFLFEAQTGRTYADFIAYSAVYSDVFCRTELTDTGERMVLTALDALSTRAVHTARSVTSLLTTNPEFFRLLNFNPDKLNYHTEANGNIVYVESHGILRTGADELLYQAAEPGGIDIASLGAANSDIYAYLQATSRLIDRLERINVQFSGGDASLRLERVSSDGASITLHFSFRCDNILLVREGDDYGLTLTFVENKLTVLRYRMCIVRRTLEEKRVPLMEWYRKMLEGAESAPMRLVYDAEEDVSSIAAQWMQGDAGIREEEVELPWDGQN